MDLTLKGDLPPLIWRFLLYALMTAWIRTRLYTSFTMTKKKTFLEISGTAMYLIYLK